MFGKEYSSESNILLSSFGEMSHKYNKILKKKNILWEFFQKIYVSVFGIPEIGLQIRSMYFQIVLKSYLIHKDPKLILDAGSGIGMYTFMLAKYFPNSKIEGWEIDKNKKVFCSQFAKVLKIQNAEFFLRDITKSKRFRNKYDIIISIDVLEHIKNYKKALMIFYNLLVPGGYLFVHIPQVNQKRIFKSLLNWHHEDHEREGFIKNLFEKDLINLGFKIILIKNTFGFVGSLAWEINHILLSKSFVLVGIFFPLLYFLAKLDLYISNKKGLGVILLVRK